MINRALAVLSLLALPLVVSAAEEEEVFHWKTKGGRSVFSSTKPSPDAVPAELPKIQKENIDRRIQKVLLDTPPNCGQHGGVDCSKGADTDGSVICLDGFRDAKLRHRFRCLSASLQRTKLQFIVENHGQRRFIPLGKVEETLKKNPALVEQSALLVTARNLSNIKAQGAHAEVRFSRRHGWEMTGPKTIEPYGIAEYRLDLAPIASLHVARRLKHLRAKLNCSNCKSVKLGR